MKAGLGLIILIILLLGMCCAWAVWRIDHGGLSLNPGRAVIERAIEARLPGKGQVTIGALTLQRLEAGQGHYQLEVTELQWALPGDQNLVSISSVTVDLDQRELQHGRVAPISIEIPLIRIKTKIGSPVDENPGRQSQLLLANSQLADWPDSDIDAWVNRVLEQWQSDHRLSRLKQMAIGSVRWSHYSSTGQSLWLLSGNDFQLNQTDNRDVAVTALAKIEALANQTDIASISFVGDYNTQHQSLALNLEINQTPAQPLLTIAGIEGKLSTDVVVDSTFTLSRNDDQSPISAKLVLRTSSGQLLVNNSLGVSDRWRVENFDLEAVYNPVKRGVSINNLAFEIGPYAGKITGFVQPDLSVPFGKKFEYSVQATPLILNLPGIFSAPVALDRLSVDGNVDRDQRLYEFQNIQLNRGAVGIKGDFALQWPEPTENDAKRKSLGIWADLQTDGKISPGYIDGYVAS